MIALRGLFSSPKAWAAVALLVVFAVPARPQLPAAIREKGSSDAETARALAVYISNLHGHIDALTALLAGYAKPAGAPTK